MEAGKFCVSRKMSIFQSNSGKNGRNRLNPAEKSVMNENKEKLFL